jgi:predicted Zn-ribbon and HTH transcriptional regulator
MRQLIHPAPPAPQFIPRTPDGERMLRQINRDSDNWQRALLDLIRDPEAQAAWIETESVAIEEEQKADAESKADTGPPKCDICGYEFAPRNVKQVVCLSADCQAERNRRTSRATKARKRAKATK